LRSSRPVTTQPSGTVPDPLEPLRFHAPIFYDKDQEAYRLDEKVEDGVLWQLPGLWFSANELRALLTMDRLLDDLQPGVLAELLGPLRKRLKIRHTRRMEGEVLEREVSPQRLVHYRDNWYLDCFCHKRQALRTFAVDAIEAVLLFNPTCARWVSRETWHPNQDGKMQLDGTYLLKFPYSREPELVMDILKYGADVEVLAPESLRKAVAEHHAEAAKQYNP